jgi:two-component system response regulator YesN
MSREGLASLVDLSPDFLSRLFNQYTEKKISDYINEKRIVYAAKLLSNTDHTITFIAHSSGFETERTFNRVFKKITKQTPSSYRKSNKK